MTYIDRERVAETLWLVSALQGRWTEVAARSYFHDLDGMRETEREGWRLRADRFIALFNTEEKS